MLFNNKQKEAVASLRAELIGSGKGLATVLNECHAADIPAHHAIAEAIRGASGPAIKTARGRFRAALKHSNDRLMYQYAETLGKAEHYTGNKGRLVISYFAPYGATVEITENPDSETYVVKVQSFTFDTFMAELTSRLKVYNPAQESKGAAELGETLNAADVQEKAALPGNASPLSVEGQLEQSRAAVELAQYQLDAEAARLADTAAWGLAQARESEILWGDAERLQRQSDYNAACLDLARAEAWGLQFDFAELIRELEKENAALRAELAELRAAKQANQAKQASK